MEKKQRFSLTSCSYGFNLQSAPTRPPPFGVQRRAEDEAVLCREEGVCVITAVGGKHLNMHADLRRFVSTFWADPPLAPNST